MVVYEDTLKSAKNIIRQAMANIKSNYGKAPHKLDSIFRVIDKENGKYARMAEPLSRFMIRILW
jgi:hypothetical protein